MKFTAIYVTGVAAVAALAACGKNDNKNNNGGFMGGGPSAAQVTADFSGAVGVLVIDSSAAGGSLHLKGIKNLSLALASSPDGSSDGSLVKVGDDGAVKSALSTGNSGEGDKPQNSCCQIQVPKVKTIAISPSKEIYLHFEHPFVYKNPENPQDWGKANDPANGYQCQIFKVKGGDLDVLRANAPSLDEGNLECLDSAHFVDSWQAGRNSVFQFDSDSNVYYPGSLPNGGGKMVVYKYNAQTGLATEVINSNICVQDFLVTKSGGVFYTGTSTCNGSNSDGGFFRYVSPASQVREIARDWWNFVFEPVEGTGATSDKALFFGPDPRSATTASWNSACLFNFDPSAGNTAAASISEKITCGADIQNWINMSRAQDISTFGNYNGGSANLPDAWTAEFKDRCTSAGNVFAGGGSQISAIKQDSSGKVYVIGKVRKKKEGSLTCSLQIKGPHCVVAGVPYLPGDATYGSAALCQAAGGATWVVDEGNCQNYPQTTRAACLADNSGSGAIWNYREVMYNNVVSPLCGESSTNSSFVANNIWSTSVSETAAGSGASTAYATTKFSRGWLGCQVKGSTGNNGGMEWTDEYKALAVVNSTSKTLSLLSGTDEQAIRLWLVNDVPYYSTFNTTEGKYFLKRWDAATSSATSVADNFEAYNLSLSNEEGSLFYDGLDFSKNAYSFGTMLQAAPYTRTIKTGLTGTVKTIVILPK